MRALLGAIDDMFVISAPGDEIALVVRRAALPPLPAGWTRTFLLYADGYSKEMDLHSASPDDAGAAAVPRDDALSVPRRRNTTRHAPSTAQYRERLQHAQ